MELSAECNDWSDFLAVLLLGLGAKLTGSSLVAIYMHNIKTLLTTAEARG